MGALKPILMHWRKELQVNYKNFSVSSLYGTWQPFSLKILYQLLFCSADATNIKRFELVGSAYVRN